MKKSALIIFVRKPELGKVKTRLAREVGDERALEIYEKLLSHTKMISLPLEVEKFVFYADEVSEKDIWTGKEFHQEQQIKGNLGEKMKSALEEVFSRNIQRVCIIGSDCMELTSEILENAFLSLHHHDIAIGPSLDGGYYLIGMKKLHSKLFDDIKWSTASVFNETMQKARQKKLSVFELPKLSDIDYKEDWERYEKNLP